MPHRVTVAGSNPAPPNLTKMKERSIMPKLDEVFKKLASDDGTSASELMRRALDEYIDRKYPVYFMNEKNRLVQQLTEPIPSSDGMAKYGDTNVNP